MWRLLIDMNAGQVLYNLSLNATWCKKYMTPNVFLDEINKCILLLDKNDPIQRPLDSIKNSLINIEKLNQVEKQETMNLCYHLVNLLWKQLEDRK